MAECQWGLQPRVGHKSLPAGHAPAPGTYFKHRWAHFPKWGQLGCCQHHQVLLNSPLLALR